MSIEGSNESPQEHYEKLLRLKLNELRVGALRKAPSFSFTVDLNFSVYASTKMHSEVQTRHGIQGEDILLEGRTRRDTEGRVQVYFHSESYAPYLFKNQADFNAFVAAVISKLQKKIDPQARTPWTKKQT